jgi:DNA-binding beta-propeller fold protein YncE
MRGILPFFLLICLPALAQEVPTATALPSSPFYLKKTWYIGGTGNWDYLTLDPAAERLFIAHGPVVQVVDVTSGSLVGQIPGFREAHAIALDDTGEYGYVSDGLAGAIKVIDRSRLAIEATIPIGCSPRSMAFEPRSRLLFAICSTTSAAANSTNAAVQPSPTRQSTSRARAAIPSSGPEQESEPGISTVVAIDTDSRSVVARMEAAGDFRFAEPDDDGRVYVSVGAADPYEVVNGKIVYSPGRLPIRHHITPRIAQFDALAIAAQAHRKLNQAPGAAPLQLDWRGGDEPSSLMRFLPRRFDCADPQGLAIDGRHQRLFAACGNQRLDVIDTSTGNAIASLTTGPGGNVLAYDAAHNLIFVANGDGYGSLTIVRQDPNTDSYAVIQNLPTRERARTIAVDPSTGDVYLVTDYNGVDLTKQGGIGTLHADPVPGSFQVFAIGQ